MLRWMREHWKLLAAIVLATLVAAALVTAFFFAPPVAAAIVLLPVIGASIATMTPVAAAFTVMAIGFIGTLIACAALSLYTRISNVLDSWIKSKKDDGDEPGPGPTPMEDEDSEDEDRITNGPSEPASTPGLNLFDRKGKGKGKVYDSDDDDDNIKNTASSAP